MYRMDGDDVVREETRVVGHMPIMVKSDRCNLRSLKPRQLIEKHEEVCVCVPHVPHVPTTTQYLQVRPCALLQPEELGGYFVINGNERIIRLLILPRRNYVCLPAIMACRQC
jgi:DNA-directed RNA polymerase I subunit RPA2